MKTLINKIYTLILLITLTSCWNTNWSEKERKEFSEKCSKQIYFNTGSICFTGFEFNEIREVKAIEKNGLEILDTILMKIEIQRDNHDKNYKRYWGQTDTEFNVNHSYEFILGSDKPYILDNMEMIMWAQYTMGGEGWGCEMGNFTIDNEKFEHRGNICITKRGFKFE